MEILDKYINQNNSGKNFLPMLSNQKTNAYLKELADICGIKNEADLSCRKTFFCGYNMSGKRDTNRNLIKKYWGTPT